MPKIKDTDYLFLSTRIKSMERNLLNGERLERMLEARTPEDAAKVLTECGWPDMPRVNLDELDRVLTLERDNSRIAPMSLIYPVDEGRASSCRFTFRLEKTE